MATPQVGLRATRNSIVNDSCQGLSYLKPATLGLAAILALTPLPEAAGASSSELEAAQELYRQGFLAYREEDYARAAKLYKESLQQAWTDTAAANLCNLRLYGQGVEQDYQGALRLCRDAAAAGNLNAMVMLGEMNLHGLGISTDEAKATEYYLLAAEQGHTHAQLMAGLLSWDVGTPEAMQTAKEWLQQADQGGHPEARSFLQRLEHELSNTFR